MQKLLLTLYRMPPLWHPIFIIKKNGDEKNGTKYSSN